MIVLLLPDVLLKPASTPKKALPKPVVFSMPAFTPKKAGRFTPAVAKERG
jgi:hypothetical protein